MPKRPTSCEYCGGPMPPPALTGRPRSFCSAQCRSAAERCRVSQQYHERQRREQEEQERAAARRRAAAEKERLKERERILKAGGPDAQWLIWNEAYTESLNKDEGGLCQWQDEVDGNYLPRQCFQRADEWDVYCAHHNRVLEERSAAYRASKHG
jgi:hypothetical protein